MTDRQAGSRRSRELYRDMEDRVFEFIPIDLNRLRLDSSLGFSLYQSSADTGRVLLVGPQERLEEPTRTSLLRSGVPVYILRRDRDRYYAHLESSLRRLIQGPEADPEKAAEAVHELATEVMKRVFEDPNDDNLIQARQIIKASVDLIISSDEALANLLRLARHDFYTYTHSINVGLFGLGLAKLLSQEGQEIDLQALGFAFFFHDLGKMRIRQEILNKPGPLTEEEMEEVRQHSRLGMEMMRELGILSPVARSVVLEHHERFDGSGYPQGLAGEEIHPYARICAIVDVFDALTSDRPYHSRMPAAPALRLMTDQMAGHFDLGLLRSFIEMFGRYGSHRTRLSS